MSPVARVVLLLLLSPAGMFVGHVIAYRGMRAAGRRPTAHTSAFAGIALCFVAVLGVAAVVLWKDSLTSFSALTSFAVYIVATYAALAIFYVDLVNIAETSLHMHLLLEVSWNDRLSLARLIDKYSPSHMIGERLERLIAMGQVRREGDKYFLGNNSSALTIAKAVDVWRTVLGMPTSPEP